MGNSSILQILTDLFISLHVTFMSRSSIFLLCLRCERH